MKPEDKNLDKALNEDELDAVSGGVFGKANVDPGSSSGSVLAASVSACSVQNDSHAADAWAGNNK